jgi:hypothetical protein
MVSLYSLQTGSLNLFNSLNFKSRFKNGLIYLLNLFNLSIYKRSYLIQNKYSLYLIRS